MMINPAVIVHGLPDARLALGVGLPVTLLSAPGATIFAGCLWWRDLVAAARIEYPRTPATDILDCANASGLAMSALRSGVRHLVLWPEAPGWSRIAAIAQRQGGSVLQQTPAALDLGQRNAARQLHAWLLHRAAKA
jgi:hypothetical protein